MPITKTKHNQLIGKVDTEIDPDHSVKLAGYLGTFSAKVPCEVCENACCLSTFLLVLDNVILTNNLMVKNMQRSYLKEEKL